MGRVILQPYRLWRLNLRAAVVTPKSLIVSLDTFLYSEKRGKLAYTG